MDRLRAVGNVLSWSRIVNPHAGRTSDTVRRHRHQHPQSEIAIREMEEIERYVRIVAARACGELPAWEGIRVVREPRR